MKVLIWSPYGFGNTYWGPGNAARSLYQQRNSCIRRLDIVSGIGPSSSYSEFVDNHYIIGSLGRNLFSQIIFLFRSYFWIVSNAERYDLVHILGSYEISIRPGLWFKSNGCKVVVKLINSDSGFVGGGVFSRILRLSDKRKKALLEFDGLIAISSRIKDQLINYGIDSNRIYCIANGVDTNRFFPIDLEGKRELKNELNITENRVILCVGEVCERKGQKYLIEGIKLLDASIRENLRVIFVGPLREDMDWFQQGVEYCSITHLEYSDNVLPYYQIADLFVLLSDNEGLSNSLLEAMACDNKILATRVSGSEDLIKNDYNGLLVNRTCNKEVSAAIFSLIHRRDLKSNRDHIVENYSTREIYHKHLKMFKHILSAK